MAATATISASTTLPVGRSTMSLVGTITSPSNASGSAGAASPAAVSHTLTSSAGQTLGGGTSGTALASAVKAAAAAIAVSKTPAPAAVVPSKAPVVASPADDTHAGHQASPAASIPVNTSPAAPVTAITAAPTSATAPAATTTAAPGSGEATTFFDDMINAPQPPANILTLSPTTSLPDLYHDFFDNHPELYDSDQSSDPEMEDLVDLEDYSSAAAIRARTMADMRQTAVSSIQLPLIADRPKLETIDTINLMLHHQTGAHGNGRQGLAHNHGQHSSDDNCASSQAPQRRKKASRACFHCQKAHLTCDDTRPCQRCVKRDLAGSCTDGVRKKAKYLQDAIDSQQRAAEQARLDQESQQAQTCANGAPSLDDAQALFSFTNVPSPVAPAPSSLSSLTAKAIAPLSPIPTSPSTETTVVPDYGFGSEAINLEYSILSTMLSSPTTELQSMTSELSMVENWQRQGTLEAMANTLQQQRRLQQLSPQQLHNSTINNNNNNSSSSSSNINTSGISANGIFGKNSGSNLQTNGSSRVSKRKFPSNTPENVYANTKQPFNYTDGFHYLLRYVRERMDKEEMMRVCRAMAMFRPSFIALIMNLTPEDLIFMETCFQRTVLEFEKLISFSGTPTVVWRRTGEIALVGKEFSLLTQWSRDQLLNKKTYIYELMDNQSAVEYWEKFSTHAFENTEQTVMTTCILLSPTNRVVPCTFCFTIKRDIFDIPLAIVGNFLPILS
ncbi:Transcriptional regulator of nonfermentable carbon utilization [Mortierella alpina]|nr:Transcriptional regulator of nonfermentable carbon utilization [Mortierella alpina]